MTIKGAQDEFNFASDACLRCSLLPWCLRIVVEDMRATWLTSALAPVLAHILAKNIFGRARQNGAEKTGP